MAKVRKRYNKYKTLQASDYIPMHERKTCAIMKCFDIFVACLQKQVYVQELLANGVMIIRLITAYELINPEINCNDIKQAIERAFKQMDHLNYENIEAHYTEKVFFTEEEKELIIYVLEEVRAHMLTLSSRLKFSIFLKQAFVDSNIYISLLAPATKKWMDTNDVDTALKILRNNINCSYKGKINANNKL